MLSCECPGDFSHTYYVLPDDYQTLQTTRRKRCSSCNQLIDIGSTVLKFERYTYGEYGDEVPASPRWMCEECGDLFYSLDELGFCLYLGDDMRALVKEYAEMRKAGYL